MATHRIKGAKQLSVELPADLVDAFKAWTKARGEKIGAAVELALRRHMAFPPPPPAPPPVPPYPIEMPDPDTRKAKQRRT